MRNQVGAIERVTHRREGGFVFESLLYYATNLLSLSIAVWAAIEWLTTGQDFTRSLSLIPFLYQGTIFYSSIINFGLQFSIVSYVLVRKGERPAYSILLSGLLLISFIWSFELIYQGLLGHWSYLMEPQVWFLALSGGLPAMAVGGRSKWSLLTSFLFVIVTGVWFLGGFPQSLLTPHYIYDFPSKLPLGMAFPLNALSKGLLSSFFVSWFLPSVKWPKRA